MPAVGSAQHVEDPTFSEDEAYASWLQVQGEEGAGTMASEVPGDGIDGEALDDEQTERAGGENEDGHDVVSRVIRSAARAHAERRVAERPAASSAAAPSSRPQLACSIGEECGLTAEVVIAILTALGGDPYSSAEDFHYIPVELVMKTAQNMPDQMAQLTPMTIGKVAKWHQKATEAWLKKKPVAPKAKEELPAQTIKVIQVPPPAAPLKKRQLRDVLEQGETAEPVEMLPEDDLLKMRYVYFKKMGGDPTEAERPTDAQLSALKSRLDSKMHPYTEFAVFGPYGERFAKQSKYTDHVWTGSSWTMKQVAGPSHLARWIKCWKVFRSSMIMCRAASISALDTYEGGIRSLMDLHPHAWHLVVVADEVCRDERWPRLKTKYAQSLPQGFNPERPWDFIIQCSSYGQDDNDMPRPLAFWWKLHVEHPAGLKPVDGHEFVASSEGLRYEHPSSWKKGGGKQAEWQDRQPALKAIKDRVVTERTETAPWQAPDWMAKRRTEFCRDWAAGRCTRKGDCPNHRIHRFPPGKKGEGKGKAKAAAKAAAAAAAAQRPGQQPPDPNSNNSKKKAAKQAKRTAGDEKHN